MSYSMNYQQQLIDEYVARATRLGLTIGDICTAAGVHRTTFSRWRLSARNPKPLDAKISSLSKIHEVLERYEQTQEQKQERATA
jgi:hypothetical protein